MCIRSVDHLVEVRTTRMSRTLDRANQRSRSVSLLGTASKLR